MSLVTIGFVSILGAKIGFISLIFLSFLSYCFIEKHGFSLALMGLSLLSGLTGTYFIVAYGIANLLVYLGLT